MQFPAGVYSPLLAKLSERFNLSALDGRPTWPNIGMPPKRRDWQIYADDLIAFIEQHYQEAIIGIVYAVATAGSILVLSRAPEGGEELKAMLVGHVLFVEWSEIGMLAALYTCIAALHWWARKPLLRISDDPEADLVTARRLGMGTVFTLSGKYADHGVLSRLDQEDWPDIICERVGDFERG